MDVDWCLSCERRLEDLPSASGPYCSAQCLSYAQPSPAVRVHQSPIPASWSGASHIRQWAQAIPPHIPAGAPTHPFADLPPPSPSSERPPSPRPRHQPTPKLIERTAASTPLPTLYVSSPVRPPLPARAPSHSYPRPNTSTSMSEASTSLTSLLSEPMVSTPDEDASFGANIGALVRTWVSGDRPKITKDYVIEKVTDYFPPLPQAKKLSSSPSSSKKSNKTPPYSPGPVSHHKLHAKKVVPFQDRDRSASAHSHTPTPVIFPSCRAAELDWVASEDEDEDELALAPQPQYHPTYYQKHEPQREFESVHWTHPVSLASSVSSSGSSILVFAPRARDGCRGRKSIRAIAA